MLSCVVRVLVVIDEGHLPSDVLRRRTDLDRTDEPAHRRSDIPGHVADRTVGSRRDPLSAPSALLGHGLVRTQIQGDDEGTGPIRRSEGEVSHPGAASRLRKAFRKAGVTSRTQLARRIMDDDRAR